MNRPCLHHEILAGETHAAAAEHCVPRGEVPARCALAEAQTAACFEEAASAGNSGDWTERPELPEAHSDAGSLEAEPVGNSDAATEPHVFPEAHSDAGFPEVESAGSSDETSPAYCAECYFPAGHWEHSSVAAPSVHSSAAVPGHDPVSVKADAAHCACHDPASPDGCYPGLADSHRDYSAGSSDNLSPVRVAKFLPAAATVRFVVLKAAEHSLPAGSPGCCFPAHWDASHTAAAYHHAGRRWDFHQAAPRSADHF